MCAHIFSSCLFQLASFLEQTVVQVCENGVGCVQCGDRAVFTSSDSWATFECGGVLRGNRMFLEHNGGYLMFCEIDITVIYFPNWLNTEKPRTELQCRWSMVITVPGRPSIALVIPWQPSLASDGPSMVTGIFVQVVKNLYAQVENI